jgi:hypothetical protein
MNYYEAGAKHEPLFNKPASSFVLSAQARPGPCYAHKHKISSKITYLA